MRVQMTQKEAIMYKIIRFFAPHLNRQSKDTGITYKTLEEAKDHCNRPETRKAGEWFEGFRKS